MKAAPEVMRAKVAAVESAVELEEPVVAEVRPEVEAWEAFRRGRRVRGWRRGAATRAPRAAARICRYLAALTRWEEAKAEPTRVRST